MAERQILLGEDAVKKERRGKSGEQKNNWSVVFATTILPTISFAWVYYNFAFEFRRRHPETALCVGFGLVACVGLACMYTAWHRLKHRHPGRDYLHLGLALWAGACFGLLLGDRTYSEYLASYYGFQDLDTYINIDPDVDKGSSYTDAGMVYFKEGTTVSTTASAAFRNSLTYCVAPIVRSAETGANGEFVATTSGAVDFWAVGTDCCDPDGKNFHCGEVDSVLARSGVRFLREDQRDFFVLAVQQWASGVGLPVRHPLFFTWVQDPLLETDGFLAQGQKAFTTHVMQFLLAAFILALCFQRLLIAAGLP